MEPVSFTGAIHEVRLKRNRDVGVAGLRGREGWEKVVVGYVTPGERTGVGGGEGEVTLFRDGSGFPRVEANGGCFFVDFGNRGQAGGGISGCSIQSFSLVQFTGEAGVPWSRGVESKTQAVGRIQEAILKGILPCQKEGVSNCHTTGRGPLLVQVP